jgi:hypothetical protein
VIFSRSPLRIGLFVLEVLALIAVFTVPADVKIYAVVALVLLIGVTFVVQLRQFGVERSQLQQTIAAHPGKMVLRTTLTEFPGLPLLQRSRVALLFADRAGLSFRGLQGVEVARVSADSILSIELAPLDRRLRVRPAIVSRIDGEQVAFTVGLTQDEQAANVVAIRTALGRPAG